ncbi:hypothetical protein V6Z12_D09G066100 [Gossypium hirsutum]
MLSSYFWMPGSSNLAEEGRKRRIMEQDKLDYVLVPLGLLLLSLYHLWLLCTIIKHPTRTVIGLNAQSRHQWVVSMMSDPLKNGVLAVQTIRNNIMASTLLATIAITLSSLISVFVSSSSDSGNTSSEIVFGNKTRLLSSIKYFSILLCFLVAFLCNVQSIRYYAHVSFLVTLSSPIDNMETVDCMMSFLLYFLDTTSSFTRQLHRHSFNENSLKADDLESISLLSEKYSVEEMNFHCPLLHAASNSSTTSNHC